MNYCLAIDVFGRWFIVHPSDARLAWSGSMWVPHYRGVGTIAQISNFATREAAAETAKQQIPVRTAEAPL